MASLFGEVFSEDPSRIAFGVNMLSAVSTAAAAMFVAWITMIFARLGFPPEKNLQNLIIPASGVVAGLATAFSTSIWFSALEGEVYALSTFFTTLTLWATVKWYNLPDRPQHDRWLLFAFYSAGMSIGVHLLSLLTFPAIALFYYFKKYHKPSIFGIIAAGISGLLLLVALQSLVITGIPTLWGKLELLMVNNFSLPYNSGLIPLFIIIAAILLTGFTIAQKRNNPMLQNIMMGLTLVIISYSVIGVAVIRANAATPVNMTQPSDAFRLLSYLNREQYGERPLLRGPHFEATPISYKTNDKYGKSSNHYEIVDYSVKPVHRKSDLMWFPRIGHDDTRRQQLYRIWLNKQQGAPTMGDNLRFFWQYQVKWMYWRYFMWNFSGRQNGYQGVINHDLRNGNWQSGIPLLDDILLHEQSQLPDTMKYDKSRNRYFLVPFLLGLFGLLFHWKARKHDTIALLALFLITGLGIIIYSNQPPGEPRERDYVLVGSFFTFCIWIGLSTVAIYKLLHRIQLPRIKTPVAITMAMMAPLLMGFQNYDDNNRRHLSGAPDYAHNFLESCDQNAILFTYTDNDTYPLWYAQEVEGIRTDVRVVNLNLIAADWYIDQMRRRVNDSLPLDFTIPRKSYQGASRNSLVFPSQVEKQPRAVSTALQFMGEDHPVMINGRQFPSYLPSTDLFLDIDRVRAVQSGWVDEQSADHVVEKIQVKVNRVLTKDKLAVLDIIANNMYDRPIYFTVTNQESNLMGLDSFMRLEGLALRFMPIKKEGQKQQFGVIGSGDIDSGKCSDLFQNTFRWGGMDQHDLFVTDSFRNIYNAHKSVIERTAIAFLNNSEKEKAIAMCNKYFEVFPHKNFPYDVNILNLIRIYDHAGAYQLAKPHLEILAKEAHQHLRFYESLSEVDLQRGFSQDQRAFVQVTQELRRLANKNGDAEFLKYMESKF